MRSLLLNGLLSSLVLLALAAPDCGLLAYYWVSLMAPQEIMYDFLRLPWGKIIVAAIFLGVIFSSEKKRIPVNSTTVLLFIFFLWTTFTLLFAVYPRYSVEYWGEFAKIVLLSYLTLTIVNSMERLHALAWIVVIALGFYTIKGGIFVLISAGNYQVFGPPTTPFVESNGMARACIMMFPLAFYLYLQSANRAVRIGALGAVGLTILSMIGTGSRGGFIAFAAQLAVFFYYSRHKLRFAAAGIAIVALTLVVLPKERLVGWTDRISTIEEYQEDASANQRFRAWEYARNMAAEHPLTGGGFGAFGGNVGLVANKPELALDAHSNYFQVLGEHGYIGLGLYLLLGLATLASTWQTQRLTRGQAALYVHRDLAIMLQIALVGYFVGGLTITHPYLEFYYMLMALSVCNLTIVERKLSPVPVGSNPLLPVDRRFAPPVKQTSGSP